MYDMTDARDVRAVFPEMCRRFALIGEDPIGEPSGFGVVWKARDTWLDQMVAIKISDEDLSWEVLLARRIDGQAVRVYEYFRGDNGGYACVMELLEAPWISFTGLARSRSYRKYDFRHHLDCLEIARGLLTALACIHGVPYARSDRFVHADVKPDNLFVRFSPAPGSRQPFRLGPRERLIKIIDLGISVEAGKVQLSGTEDYDAPVTVERPGCDLYSASMTILELASGVHPGHAVLRHKARIRDFVEANSSGSSYLDGLMVQTTTLCARAATNKSISSTSVLSEMERDLFGLDPVYVVILAAIAQLPEPGLKKAELADLLFSALSPWFGWSNQSAGRMDLIKRMILEMYQCGMLMRHGHSYWTR